MANFIQYLQTNQNSYRLTEYGGIAPLSNSKWWIGEANQDPKENPQEVFILDALGHKQILQQPIFTDDKGNFIESKDSHLSPAIYPQIDGTEYSLYIEDITGGHFNITQRRVVPVFLDNTEFITKAEFTKEQTRVNTVLADLQSQIDAKP